ncbi:MAG: tetratricopeptide repeat protein [Calditrichia bacterium]|nr:tetratricopeptide repeat protein [Calditrichia bacterium]
MKKLFVVSAVIGLFFILLILGCRPPEVEGVVINMNQGLYDKAYDLAKEAVQKYPTNAEAWYLLGELHGRFEKFEEMNQAFEKSLSIGPKFKTEIEQLQNKYFAENYNAALRKYYTPARDEQDPEKRKELFSQAAEKFLYAHQSMPSRIEPLTPMSVSFLETGDTATAEKYVLKAIDMNPDNDTLMVTVGDFYYNSDQVDKALAMYERALGVNNNSVDAMLAIGEIYSKQEKWDEALAKFRTAMDLQPSNPAIPNNVAIILYTEKKYTEALTYIKKTIELEPENQNAYELLSLSYMQSAQELNDKFSETEDASYKQKADALYDEALPVLEDAVRKFPDSSLLWNNMGVCYAQKGMKDKAQEAFEMQKKLDGN